MQVGVPRISYALKFARFAIRATHARVQSRGLVSVLGSRPARGGRSAKIDTAIQDCEGYNRSALATPEREGNCALQQGGQPVVAERLFGFIEVGSHDTNSLKLPGLHPASILVPHRQLQFSVSLGDSGEYFIT